MLFAFLLFAIPAYAGPRDVRRVLAENGFLPDTKTKGQVIGYPEPSIMTAPHGPSSKPVFISEFDPLPTVSKTLTKRQAQQFAAILADRHTYNLDFGGGCGGFHADVAVRIPSGVYILLCFHCDQIALLQYGEQIAFANLAFADMDHGRNRLLEFLRMTFPKNKDFQRLPLRKGKELKRFTAQDVLDYAQLIIPEDPLFKHAMTLKPEEIPEDDLEELDVRCTAQLKKWGEVEKDERHKLGQRNASPEGTSDR